MQKHESLNKCDYEEQLHLALSRISHEIRNPVTLISSSLQIIEEEHPEVRDFHFWDDVKGDLSYIITLLNDPATTMEIPFPRNSLIQVSG